MLEDGLSIGFLRFLNPKCEDCGERGVHHYDYNKTCCPECGKNLLRGGVKP